MWVLVFTIFLLTLIVHCIWMRINKDASQVFCFLCIGTLAGMLHIILSFSIFGYTEEAFVSVLVYTAICLFILHLFSLTVNGVSVSILDKLSKLPTDLNTLDAGYSTISMITRRINQLQRDGFLVSHNDGLQVTAKGIILTRSFLRLRTFLGHEIPKYLS